MLKTLYAIYVVSANSFVPYPLEMANGARLFEKDVCEAAIEIVERDFDSGVYGKIDNSHALVCLPTYIREISNDN